MRISVGHLYPGYLNIYADRGNIAVLARRAALRGHELDVRPVGVGDRFDSDAYHLLYIGGGQDREQALIAPDLVDKGEAIRSAHSAGVAVLAVRRVSAADAVIAVATVRSWAASASPLETVAGTRRMIGDVLLECELDPGEPHRLAGFENHAGRTLLDRGATPSDGSFTDSGTTASRASRAAGVVVRSGRTSTGHCFPGTRGWRTGSWLRLSRMPR